jgi:putative FmdB family regulatory protein
MPTYDYRCRACEHEFEAFQSMKDKPLRKCPECGKLKLERLIGMGAGVIFKGGGFYETDYRSESYTKAAEAEKKAASGDGDAKSAGTGKDTADGGASSGSKDSGSKDSGSKDSTTKGSGANAASSATGKASPSKPTRGGNSNSGAGNRSGSGA